MEIRSLSNWITTIFMFAYWVLRLIVAYTYATGKNFFITPFNQTFEIIILFVSFFGIVLIFKRKMLGAIAYAVSYGLYFGSELASYFPVLMSQSMVDEVVLMQIIICTFGILLPIMGVMGIAMDRIKSPKANKTSWFFDNKDFDRKKDTRADKNNYKLY